MATKWTLEQESIILEEVKKSPEHLRDAFYNASLRIERSTESICTHYYNKMIDFDKIQRGGKRQNSGAKPKYTEPTKTTAFRIPISKIDEVKKLVREFLASCKGKNNQ